jgi:hypothetical protein
MFQSNCRECQKNYRKTHYLKNKKKYIGKASDYRKNMIEWFYEIKKELKCEICDEKRYWVLDFHHNNPDEKHDEVSILIRKGSKKKILEEIEKCSVLCANCHRDLHFNEKNSKGNNLWKK